MAYKSRHAKPSAAVVAGRRARLAAGTGAVVAVAGASAVAAVPAAFAATGPVSYADQVLTASRVWQHTIAGSAASRNVVGSPVVKVSGLQSTTGDGSVTYALAGTGPVVVDGVRITAQFAAAGTAQGGGTDPANEFGNVLLVATGTPTTGGANANGTVELTATAASGAVAKVLVPVTVGTNSVQVNGAATTDEVNSIKAANDNTTGNVVFTAANNLGSAVSGVVIGNAPAGVSVAGDSLIAGQSTAVPGRYSGLTATETDPSGAREVADFGLAVKGVPVTSASPVLSHGSSVATSPNRAKVYFESSKSTDVDFTIVGYGAINGHKGTVHAQGGGVLNAAVYSGLVGGHKYEVTFVPVDNEGNVDGPFGQVDIVTPK